MISHRKAKLRRSFRLVALAAIGADIYACEPAAKIVYLGGDDGGEDSSVSSVDDDTPGKDATTKADGTTDPDTGLLGIDASCAATVSAVDAGADAEEFCNFLLPCGLQPEGLATVGCQVLPTDTSGNILDAAPGFPVCMMLDGLGCFDGGYQPNEAGISFTCIGCPGGGGRRPAGYAQNAVKMARSAIGAHLTELYALEAASIGAFRRMARELTAHGAPRTLVRASRQSARDEVRHTRTMGTLAARFGARTEAPRLRKVGARSLSALAKENAIEGCVRETFGALVNAWQAEHAKDPQVRAAMKTIADDELRHAAVSWEIAAWAMPKLRPSERRAITRAQKRAASQLVARASETAGADAKLRDVMGLPSPDVCGRLARGLVGALELV